MQNQIENRLNELKAEFESGQKMMQDLEQKRTNLEKTMLRISGAIQVLEELLSQAHMPDNAMVIDGNHHEKQN